MRKKKEAHGMKTEGIRNGILRCAECGQILGCFSEEHCKQLYLHFLCKCGNSAYLLDGKWEEEREPEAADLVGNRVLCAVCKKELFSFTEQVKSFGFRAECACGRRFESVYPRKRELYKVEKENG